MYHAHFAWPGLGTGRAPSGTGRPKCCLECSDKRRVQGSQKRPLPVRRRWRNGEPLRGVWQIESAFQVELGVVAQPRRLIGGRIALAQDRELASAQGRRSLAGAVCDANDEGRCVVIEDCQNERRAGLGPAADAVGKSAPDDLTCGRLGPGLLSHRRVPGPAGWFGPNDFRVVRRVWRSAASGRRSTGHRRPHIAAGREAPVRAVRGEWLVFRQRRVARQDASQFAG